MGTKETMDKNNSLFTKTEIEGQPQLWQSVYELLLEQEAETKEFLEPLLKKENLEIILTGAGSSAFLGEAAQPLVQNRTQRSTKAIPTTDLVTHPHLYLQSRTPTLLFSFARSGNSPESLEAVRLAEMFCEEVYHFIITCNKDGELIEFCNNKPQNAFALLLPESANDQSLAMTGSFTSMLLTILLLSNPKSIEERKEEVELIERQGQLLLGNKLAFEELSSKEFERVVFLGSGPLLGIARECHLKLQEMTDGKVICKHDSFLGFRHGPRAVINEKTLLVYLFSPSDHVYRYELDLAESIAKDSRKVECLSIGRPEEESLNACFNVDLKLESDQELNAVPTTLVGQLLGYYKSLSLGFNPDNPSVSGSISRVVQGVIIYDNEILLNR